MSIPSNCGMGVLVGKTDEHGSFKLNSRTYSDIQAGWYIVLFAKEVPTTLAPPAQKKVGSLPPPPGTARKNILPAKYFNPVNLMVELRRDANALAPFNLTRQ